ncbi:MAG: hypothetical protein ACI9WS_000965 [Paraglaciecola psychrophila]|jgi:hypothetical protein
MGLFRANISQTSAIKVLSLTRLDINPALPQILPSLRSMLSRNSNTEQLQKQIS